jgi:methionyl-tRNA formyltransferase
MGTPDFAVPALRALHESEHMIVAVYCQRPKPAGRGQTLQKTPVHIDAERLGLDVRTPKTLRDPAEQEIIKSLNLDAVVVAAYGLILPQAVLDSLKFGGLVIHPSLLPRWRGTSPVHHTLLAGDAETGVTIMQMDAGIDTGPILLVKKVPVKPTATSPVLYHELFTLGGHMAVEALNGLADGSLKPVPQPSEGMTYAFKLTREHGKIDWHKPAVVLERQVRAFTPWPGTFFQMGDEQVKVLEAMVVPDKRGTPGTLLDDKFTVACGEQALRLTKVQRAGKKATDGASLLRGLRLAMGSLLA